MKAIPTLYRSTLFRSRLEARWAAAFDQIGVVWEFEPEGIELTDGTRYLPDFWLPLVCSRGKPGGVYFEVKPSSPSEGERHKARLLAWKTRIPVIVVYRSPQHPTIEAFEEFVGGENGWHDCGLCLQRCENCGQVSFDFPSQHPPCSCGKDVFVPYSVTLETMRQGFANLVRWQRAA